MIQKSQKKYIPAIGVLSLMLMTSSCYHDPYYHASYYYGPPSSYHVVGTYYPYDYYYYPSVRVYFQYSSGFYFYISNGRWIRNRTLPPHVRLNPSDRVFLRLKSDKPYHSNRQHVEKYRPHPKVKPTPSTDRKERTSHQKWYKEQQVYKKQQEQKEKKSKDKRHR